MTRAALIVGLDGDGREALETVLAEEGWETLAVPDVHATRSALAGEAFALVLLHRDAEGLDGLDPLPQIARWSPEATVALVSADDGGRLAETGLQRGAEEVLGLPVDPSALKLVLSRCAERSRLRQLAASRARDAARAGGEPPIVAASAAMIELLEALEQAAGCDAPVLLCGESGSGKENLARAIHAQSRRRRGPFLAVDCATSDPERLHGELFGRTTPSTQRGPALWEQAQEGSLYLSEVETLPAALQTAIAETTENAALDRGPDTKPLPLDVRLLASCSRPPVPEEALETVASALRGPLADLAIEVPPLRQRRDDIPLLVDHLVARFRTEVASPARTIGDEALERLTAYPWPGNLRELANVVERAVLRAEGEVIGLRELPPDVVETPCVGGGAGGDDFSLRRARREAEIQAIRRALRATSGNRTHAARALGVSHRALLYKLKEYRLS